MTKDNDPSRLQQELDYIREWSDAVECKDYSQALLILNRALSRKRRSRDGPLKEWFLRELRQATKEFMKGSDADGVPLFIKEKTASLRCSFCGKTRKEVEHIIAGPGVFICNGCVRLCSTILRELRKEKHAHSHKPNA
jgi:hypothetical protein